jgi:hypothetical protein
VTLDELAVVVGVVALGPWGLVLVVALVRGYDLSIRLRRPRRRSVRGMNKTPENAPRPDQVEGKVEPAVVPAVVPEVVEPDPPARVDEDKLDEVVERADVTDEPDKGKREGKR